ncbi:MAG: FG-GAP-like repeat-containing protein [Acidobacteriota bacterium]|nr:FG-GAP-like repeat-containing protein [Acidobacteriota bacterium]
MKVLTNRKNIIALFMVSTALLLSTSLSHAQRFSAWSTAQNLGPTFNTTSSEVCPFIAPDNLSLFFASDRAGGTGGFDLYVSTRPNANAPWGMPVNLGTNINTTGGELCPTVLPGGLSLYFISDKPGGCGGNDIYVSQRMNNQSEWGPAVNLGCQLNSPQSEMSPSLFTDAGGTTNLYFSSNRPGGPGMTDIYVSTLQPGGQFGAPALVEGLNTAFNDQRPNIRVRDGLEIFFESDRTGTVGLADLYVSTRASTSAPWSTPVNLGVTVNSASVESRPSLSFDGRELYFFSNRPGGVGANDIYIARRRVIFTPYDVDGDGRSDIRAYRQSAGAFYILNSSSNSMSTYSFGGTGQGLFIPGLSDDYDGDGKSDLVVFTAPTGGARTWSVLQSGNNTIRTVQWGFSSDQTVPADYDGDGRTDIAVYRNSEGIWYILLSTTNQMRAEYWGQGPNDIAMVGDFDGDGINDLTVVRPSTSGGVATWFTRRSSDGTMLVDYWGGGVPGASDNLFPAISPDVDGDGIRDRMVLRDPNSAATGDQLTYFIQRSSDRSMLSLPWGLDTDGRAFGDFDGDGKTDFVARRNISGQLVWFILLSSNNYNTTQARVVYWGIAGDL